jgi:CelD/BcsL family acetyltransferase involved in cellulose biosynthesis
MMEMAILELQYKHEFNDFERVWSQLLPKSLDDHPFLTFEWLHSWMKNFGKGRELKFFTVENEGEISLAIPVMYSSRRILGLKHCKIEFVAAPDSDYQVFLLTSFQEAARNVNQLIESIMQDTSDVDCAVFRDVPENSLTYKLLEKVNINGFEVSSSISSSCPYIPLTNNYEQFFQSLGHNMRRNLKISERQALKDYNVEFLRYDEIGTVDKAMKILFELHQKSQMAKGNAGVFSDSTKRSFHMDVANSFSKKGWLALFFLTFNGIPVSTVYAYEYNEKLYAYLCGFDPKYSNYRPGNLAFKNLIKYGIEKKLKELDFLRGDEEYKMRWGASVRNNFDFKIMNKGFKSKIYNWTTNNRALSSLYGMSAIPKISAHAYSRLRISSR